jgi:hypothetical protein
MDSTPVKNWAQLLEEIQSPEYDRSSFIFRGVTNANHKLRPKVGRDTECRKRFTKAREKDLYERFNQYSALFRTGRPNDP